MTLDDARNKIGSKVIYRTAYGRTEEGVITSVNASYVFVRYGSDVTSKATAADALELLAGYVQ